MNTISDLESPTLQARNGKMGIYIHYPYCYKKCDYCDFFSEGIGPKPSSTEDSLFDTYRLEFLKRKETSNQMKQYSIDTIFVGGGTPSKASPTNWKKLFQFFRNEVSISSDVEVSIEANPEDLSDEFIEEIHDAGFNRLNIGVQTRNPEALAFLGRHFDKSKYDELKTLFSKSKIKRLGIDLMYGIPNLPKDVFLSDLEYYLSLDLKHLSLYSLTVEKGTAYSRKVTEKRMASPDEELQRDILEFLPNRMREAGFIWYEVSNYCKKGEFSRHNLRYWTLEPYLGLGPGAHGFLDHLRYGNARNTNSYLKNPNRAILEPSSPREEIAISLFRLFLPLKLDSFFAAHLKEKEAILMTKHIETFKEKNLCDWDGNTFRWRLSALFQLDDLISTLAIAD